MSERSPEKAKDAGEGRQSLERSWAERHGGLIVILIAFGFIALLVFYELATG